MKRNVQEEYRKALIQLVDSLGTPAILCSMKSDKNSFKFPKILHCNNLFEQVFSKKLKSVVKKDFDTVLNLEFPNNGYITFIKHIKEFRPTEAEVKTKIGRKDRRFRVQFHPLFFFSDNKNKYCLFCYDAVKNKTKNLAEIYDYFHKEEKKKTESENLKQMMDNDVFIKKVYEIIDRDLDLKKSLTKVVNSLAEYLKVCRVIFQLHNQKEKKGRFVEYNERDFAKITAEKNKKSRANYLFITKKFLKEEFGEDENPRVLVVDDVGKKIKNERYKEVFDEFEIKSQMVIENRVQKDLFIRMHVHYCDRKKKWKKHEINLVGKIVERLAHTMEKGITLQKLKKANIKLQDRTKELKRALSKEKEMRKIQNEFVAMVSHQFKTPLQIITGVGEVMKRKIGKINLPTKDREFFSSLFKKIKGTVSRVDSLIDKTLDLSRIEIKGDIVYSPKEIEIKRVLLNSIGRYRDNIKNIKIKASLNNLPQSFFGDESLLEHAFNNLLDNAIKYSNAGGTIVMNTEVNKKQFIISIQDFGLGIPEENMEKIFEKFSRGKNVLTLNGTGIGLFLTKKFIKKNGGTIKVMSEVNKGTTFYISFPINKKG